jgi:TRAP-type C4-dicarboxylate transport system substrate-binding protein
MTGRATITLRLSLAAALAAFAAGGAAAQELPSTHLKVVGGWDFLVQYKDFEKPFWEKTIPEVTAGSVTAEITPFNALGLKGAEIIRLMKLGVIDFGTTVLAYGAEADVESEGIDLAGLNDDVARARSVSAAYFPVLDEFFQSKHGIKVLAIWPYPAQVIFCKSPIKGLADLKGRKIRVGTRPIAEFVEALGGVALNIPFGDAVGKLKEGAADCGVTGSLSGNAAHWYEATQYLYPLSLGWSMSMQAVSLAAWERLDPRVQTILAAEIDKLGRAIWDRAELDTLEGLNCNTGLGSCTRGVKAQMALVRVAESDRKLLSQVLRQVVIKRWAQRCGAECTRNWNKTVGKVVNIQAEP